MTGSLAFNNRKYGIHRKRIAPKKRPKNKLVAGDKLFIYVPAITKSMFLIYSVVVVSVWPTGTQFMTIESKATKRAYKRGETESNNSRTRDGHYIFIKRGNLWRAPPCQMN